MLGLVLWKQGRLDQAATALRKAIELRPELAETHCNLGLVLRQRGEFTSALERLKRGHELGSQRADWPYPSALWLKECQRLIELDGRLPAVLSGETRPANANERREYAELRYYKNLYVASARLWAGAFADGLRPDDDLNAGYRCSAASAAALAGCGQGSDPDTLAEGERARWRGQALEWLRADLLAYRELRDGGKTDDFRFVRQRLRHLLTDPVLAGVRDPAEVAKLPPGEREGLASYWSEVRELLSEVETTK